MSTIKSLEELKRLREEAIHKQKAKLTSGKAQIIIGMGTCGIAAGARETVKAILETIETEDLSGILVKQTGCMGLCEWEPLVEVIEQEDRVRYRNVDAERARRIIKEHVMGGNPIDEFRVPVE